MSRVNFTNYCTFLSNVIQKNILYRPRYLFILVRRDSDKLGLFEDVSSERAARQCVEIAGLNEVKSRLVFMHRIQNGLQKQRETLQFACSPVGLIDK